MKKAQENFTCKKNMIKVKWSHMDTPYIAHGTCELRGMSSAHNYKAMQNQQTPHEWTGGCHIHCCSDINP